MTSEPIVHFVDDDPAARESLLQLARSVGLTAYTYGSGEEFLDQVPAQPGCVVLDIRLPGVSGLEVHRRVNQANLPLIVIYLSAHADVPTTVQAMKLGAFELFQKPCNTTRLIEAIRQALDKNQQTFEKHIKRQEADQLLQGLSAEETKVLELMFLGRTNQEIADRLQLSLRTVQFRRSSIFRKTNVNSKARLFDMLFDAGWSPTPVPQIQEAGRRDG
ncbi:DNA-binding response regulator [Blastopirellula marina]|uniref:DNA-binding response regulator n=1 Tax=Blastopirellula marina TaxID=124 RepID=A0A2S8FG39_9BACT|nr:MULTISPECIES: response regulator [Pirellulaceae]PQO31133.1 DNA-binding response regulator [Blastopirellula marina]RCS51527.1 DNA-binding response regulator [Bremerella cremea]